MTSNTAQKKLRSRDALIIVSTVAFVVSMLFAFEQITGLPASIRGTQVYNSLPMPSGSYNEYEESRIPTTSTLTKERVCDRISRNFGWNSDIWERVSTRVFERLGFKCRQ